MKKEIAKDYYENGLIKSEGMRITSTDCLSIGGPLDCQGKGCVECLIGLITRKDGMWKYYYNNGNLKMKGKYKVFRFIGLPEVKIGKWEYYYNNGNLKMEGEYNGHNDKLGEDWDLRCGVWKVYYKTGQLSDEITYKNGEEV